MRGKIRFLFCPGLPWLLCLMVATFKPYPRRDPDAHDRLPMLHNFRTPFLRPDVSRPRKRYGCANLTEDLP